MEPQTVGPEKEQLIRDLQVKIVRIEPVEALKIPRLQPDSEVVRWEMDPQGDFRTRLDEGNDVRVFTCGFVIRGFDIDEGWPLDIGHRVESTQIESTPMEQGEIP